MYDPPKANHLRMFCRNLRMALSHIISAMELDCPFFSSGSDDDEPSTLSQTIDMPSESSSSRSLHAVDQEKPLYGTKKRDIERAKKEFLTGEFPADEPVDRNLLDEFTFEELTSDYRRSSARDRDDDDDERKTPFPFDALPREVKDEFWSSFVKLAEQRTVIRSHNSSIMESIDESGEHAVHARTPEIPREAIEKALLGSANCYDLFVGLPASEDQFDRLYDRLYLHRQIEVLIGSYGGRRGYRNLDSFGEKAALSDVLSKLPFPSDEREIDLGCWAVDARATILVLVALSRKSLSVIGHCYFPCSCLRQEMEKEPMK